MQILHQISKDFDEYLSGQAFTNEPVELYGPINYMLGIRGKRLRPAILLLANYLFEGKYSKALPAAFAIEIFHNFTLVHDDIMDEAPLRRGKLTVQKKYNLNTAILSGDVMMVLAYKFLMENTDTLILPKVLKVFNKFAVEVCEGQQMDMNFENRDSVTIEEYIRMIELKTSVLLAGAMEIGALIGGATDDDAALLYEFGRNLGIAFQLQDDLLDTYGDPEKFGKKVGGDIVQNKKTILFLKASELAGPSMKEELLKLYQTNGINESEKIRKVIEIFDHLDIKSHISRVQEKYQGEAFRCLSLLNAPNERKEVVERFAQDLMQREL